MDNTIQYYYMVLGRATPESKSAYIYHSNLLCFRDKPELFIQNKFFMHIRLFKQQGWYF